MPQPLRILFITDPSTDTAAYGRELERSEFTPVCERVTTEADLLNALQAPTPPEVVVADGTVTGLPVSRALQLLKESQPDLPLIVVAEAEAAEGVLDYVRQGAANYVLKDRLGRLGPAMRRALDERQLRAESRQAEAALRASEARFRALIENSLDAFSLIMPDGELTYTSPSNERITGYAPAEFIGRNIYTLVHPDDARRVAEWLERVQREPGARVEASARVHHKDNSWHWIEGTLVNLLQDPIVRAIVANYRDVTERRRTEQALHENETRLQLLNGILIGVTSGLSVEAIIRRTLKRVAQAFPQFRVLYGTIDAAGVLTIVDSVEPAGRPNLRGYVASLTGIPEYLTALRQHELVALEDVTTDARFAPYAPAFAKNQTRALMNVALQHSEPSLVGMLGFNAFEAHEWSDHEATALTEIADYLSIALQEAHTLQERRRAETQLQERARELTALSHMGQVVAASLDVDEVLRQVIGEVSHLLGAEGLAVELLSEDGQELVFAAVGGVSAHTLSGLHVPSHSGVAGEVLRTRRSIRLPADSSLTAAPEVLQYIGGYRPRAILGVPLRLHGEVIGVMLAVHSHAEAFTSDDLHLLEAAADWASIAIGNARLFSETNEALVREKRLDAVTRTISGALDLPTTLQNVVRLACELVGAQAGALALVEPDGDALRFSYLFNLPEKLAEEAVVRGQGVGWAIVESGESVLLANYADHPKAREDWKVAGIRGFIGVPLVVGEARLGVLGLFSLTSEKRFSTRDLTLAESVGRQAGVALQNARLFEAERRRVAALTALNKTGLDLSAELDLNTLLRTVLDRSARLLESPFGALHILLPDHQTLELVVSLSGKYDGTFLKLGEGVSGQVAQTGQSLVIGDYEAWPGRLTRYDTPMRSVIGMPIKWPSEGVLGVLVVGDIRLNRYGPPDVEIVSLFADQAAVAIVNMRQHTSLRRRLQESEAMAAISRALNETLNAERILLMIVDAARRIIPQVEQAVIHLLDEEKQALRPAAVSGTDADKRGRREITMRPGAGVAGQAMAEGVVINVGDTLTDPRYLPLGRASKMRSLLVAPVQSGQRRLGTISVQSTTPHAFSTDDEWLLATLGVQAALAIENARLFEIERRRAEEAEALQHVTGPLISRLNLPEMLRTVVDAITTIANYKYVSIFLLEGNQLAVQAQKGYAQPLPSLSLEQGVCGRVARTGQPALVVDVNRDPDYVDVMPTVRSLIGVPLIHTNQTLGVLMVESDAEQALDQSDLHWLTNVGRHLSVAIQNTRLVADLEKALQQEKAARAQMVQTEKLAAMGRLVASVAHELNNPLQAIQNALYLVKQERGLGAQAREDLQVALGETDRMAELISRLRETYRPATREDFQPESLNLLVEDVRRLIITHLRHSQVTCEVQADPRLPLVRGLRDQLKQALINLSLNAVEAMPDGGQLTIRTEYQSHSSGVLLTIADTGVGIPPEALPNVFDPFYTTKESGTGLGLAITHDIIRRHGGEIEVHSELNHGTTFRVWLPADRN